MLLVDERPDPDRRSRARRLRGLVRDEDTGRISGWLVALAIIAIVLAAWNVWQSRERTLVAGDLAAIGTVDDAAPTPRVHPLVSSPSVASWTQVADGDALGRGGSGILDDVQVVFDGRVGAIDPVPAATVGAGQLAWATPRQVHLVDITSRALAGRVDACEDGVDAVTGAGGLLVIGACGRALAVGSDGAVAWSVDLDGSGDARVLLHAVGDGVVAGRIDSRELVRIDSSGERDWRVDLRSDLRSLAPIGPDSLATISIDGDATLVTRVDPSSGTVDWQRRWNGWRSTAAASDSRRLVLGLVQVRADRCGSSGIAQLDAASGATTGTRALDRRVQVSSLQADAGTSRMASLVTARSCSLERVTPRVDLLRAKSLDTVHRVPLDERPCSSLAARARLVVVTTCDEAIAIDALDASIRWRVAVPATQSRRALTATIGAREVAVTDDVGSLLVVEPAGGSAPKPES